MLRSAPCHCSHWDPGTKGDVDAPIAKELEKEIEATRNKAAARGPCGHVDDSPPRKEAPSRQPEYTSVLRCLVILTGDSEGIAGAITSEAGIDEFRCQRLPEDNVEDIGRLVREYKHVAMVGDGINDAPAMAAATFGIAVGAMGTDAALETANVALMSDHLSRVPWLIRHSRRTLGVIKQNISFALGLRVVFILLTLLGLASLWMAIAADTGATLLVVFNGLRLLGGGSRDFQT